MHAYDDDVWMTRNLDVTPMTIIVYSGKSDAELTSNRRLHCTY